jgi:hypothetical protein
MTGHLEVSQRSGATSEASDGRRRFIKGALLAGGGAVAGPHLISVAQAQTQPGSPGTQERASHYFIPATDKTVHWGYFSKSLKPLVEVDSGDYVTIEALTHHAYDDYERMIKGDPGAESVFLWTREKKNVNRRGAGPMDASIHGRGRAKVLASISAPAPSRYAVPSPATSSKSVSSM